MSDETREKMQRASGMIVEPMRLLFANHGPDVQGAALVELLAIFIAGHHPKVRAETLALIVEAALRLVPIVEIEIGEPWKDERN